MIKVPEQSNYQNNQNFGNIDINKIYDIFISEIDSIRSSVNISNSIGLLNNIPEGEIPSLMKNVKIESSVQESRCHAFYRLVGFPVVDKDNKYYSPGYDSPKFVKTISLENKRLIANNISDDFRKLSFMRESYQKNIANVFSNPNFSTGVLSLLTVNHRDFISAIRSDDPFDFSYNEYQINLNNMVGDNAISIGDYLDNNGNGISDSCKTILKSQSHIITPFIVDPRIDFTAPPTCKVSVPFVSSSSQLNIGDGQVAKVPMLERVIFERILDIKQTDTEDKSIDDAIKSFTFIKDDVLIKKAGSKSLTSLEKAQFVEFANIILSMMKELATARQNIINVQSKYYFVPEISESGPISGCSARAPFLSKYIYEKNPLLVTNADKGIINANLYVETNRLYRQFNDDNSISDVAGLSISKFDTIFSRSDVEGIESNVGESLSSLLSLRKNAISKVSNSFKSIEIITGEFSGFGLCDIIAIVASLYMVPIEALFGLLDADAFNRMNKKFNTNFVQSTPVEESLKYIHTSVKDFYNLMDKVYVDTIKNIVNY